MGFTKISNHALDKLATVELSGSDARIVFVVIRKVNGFNKKRDWISIGQFQQLTGLSRFSVCKALQRLCNAGILRKQLVSKRKLPAYSLSPTLEKWVVSKRKLVSNCNKSSYQTLTRVVSKRKLYKRNSYKRNTTKEKENPLYKKFIKMFNTLLDSKFRGDSKSRRQLNQRVKEGRTLEDFRRAIENAMKDDWMMGRDKRAGRRYLTPEYITRGDKLDKWINTKVGDSGVEYI